MPNLLTMGLLNKFKKTTKEKDRKAERKAAEFKPAGKVKKEGGEDKQSMKDLYKDKQTQIKKIKSSTKKKTETKASIKTEKKLGNAYRVLVKPIVTEKASFLGSENKYIFAVKPKANKIEIAKAIEEVYGIKPISINIIKMRGKQVRFGKSRGKTKNWKKAVITLPQGQTIKVYEGV